MGNIFYLQKRNKIMQIVLLLLLIGVGVFCYKQEDQMHLKLKLKALEIPEAYLTLEVSGLKKKLTESLLKKSINI